MRDLVIQNGRILVKGKNNYIDLFESYGEHAWQKLRLVKHTSGESLPRLNDIKDLVLVDYDDVFYEKVGNKIMNKYGETVGIIQDNRAFVFLFDRPEERHISDALAFFKVDAITIGVTKKVHPIEIVGMQKDLSRPIIRTDYGLYINKMFFDEKWESTLCSPIFQRFEFYLFPVIALGEEVDISDNEERLFYNARLRLSVLESLIKAFENGKEVIGRLHWKSYDPLVLDEHYRKLIYTKIKPRLEVEVLYEGIVSTWYLEYYIKDEF